MPRKRQRAGTLSISLPPELRRIVLDRVASGLYTSASELIREALRMLLQVEQQRDRPIANPGSDPVMDRARRTAELLELGDAVAESRASRADPQARAAADRVKDALDAGQVSPFLRPSPERLARLRNDDE